MVIAPDPMGRRDLRVFPDVARTRMVVAAGPQAEMITVPRLRVYPMAARTRMVVAWPPEADTFEATEPPAPGRHAVTGRATFTVRSPVAVQAPAGEPRSGVTAPRPGLAVGRVIRVPATPGVLALRSTNSERSMTPPPASPRPRPADSG